MGIKVKKKMRQVFQRIFCLFLILTTACSGLAQVVDDAAIPLFMLEDETEQDIVEETVQKTNIPPSQPIMFDSKNPKIGRDAAPLTQVTLAPEPAPEIIVKLPQLDKKKIQKSLPKKTENTRLEAIQLSTDITPSSLNPSIASNRNIGQTSDVRGFELEGMYLGMTPDEIIQLANENNYKIVSSKNTISKFRAGYYESLCKSRKIYLPADIRACINQMSQQNNTTYLSELKISRPKTHEYMEFYFTSPATDNRLWKIIYQNKGDNSLNFTRANTQKKIERRDAFLNAVYNKFGHPDNVEKLLWGNENDAFMQIGIYGSNYDAYITLTDVLLSDDDYFEAEDWLQENKPFERFGFED